MLKKSIIVAGTMLFAASAFAQTGMKNTVPSNTPGQMMQNDTKSTRGASEYAPGQKMQEEKKAGTNTGNGASNYTPPAQTTGSSMKK